jgi:hypothetical protein
MLHKTIADVMFNVGFEIPLSQNQYYNLIKEVNRLGGKVLLKGNSTAKEKDDEYSLVAKINRINSKKLAKFCDNNKMYYRCFDATTDKEITKQFKTVGNSNNIYLYKRRVVTASSKSEVISSSINDITDFNEYKKKFDAYWKPKIDTFKKEAGNLKYIEYNLWLTDCDDYSKFARYSFDANYKVEDCPIELDWWIKHEDIDDSINIKNALYTLVERKVGDCYSRAIMYGDGFWRDETPINLDSDIKQMTEANNLVDKIIKLVGIK